MSGLNCASDMLASRYLVPMDSLILVESEVGVAAVVVVVGFFELRCGSLVVERGILCYWWLLRNCR
jgi:hypothetical protein